MTAKELAIRSISRLSDDVTLDAIARTLEFMTGIQRGLDQIKSGEMVTHQDVKSELVKWLSK